MATSPFPEEVPHVGDLLKISLVTVDLVVRTYKFFVQESYVSSRFYAKDYADREYIEIIVGGQLEKICFGLEHKSWFMNFDGQRIQLEVEKIGD
ncbi:hypothetical protein KW783_03615 [Candidatus Parcubacteria bacterium]|nr:hypothetical protein [Candidatus Parcubacteria bacterium]